MEKISIHSLPINFDIQGHRGCRGLHPENTLEAFNKALELGVNTLEMDLVISKDHKVVVSHEPYFNPEISLTPEGNTIRNEDELNHNLFLMTYDEIKKYDVGKLIHPRFPKQIKHAAYKPLFEEVVDYAEAYCSKFHKTIGYNIEIKSTKEWDNIFHPSITLYVDLVVQILKKKGIVERTMIQSFDTRALQYLNNNYPEVTASYLLENQLPFEANLELLGFVPQIYSPEYAIVDKELVNSAHKHSMKVIPWTVNKVDILKELINYGVDGVITDYPDLFEL